MIPGAAPEMRPLFPGGPLSRGLDSLETVTFGVNPDPHGGPSLRAQDQLRTARLLFDAELASGVLRPAALSLPAVAAATRVQRVRPRPLRLLEQARYKLGRLDFKSGVVEPLIAAREAALGKDGAAPPRFLIRVDEFPHYRAWDDPERFGTAEFERFHEIMAGAGVPYLVAVLPRVSREPLSPAASAWRPLEDTERTMLERLRADQVTFALHGRDHRTRFSSPRRRSELRGLSVAQTERLLDGALAELAAQEIHPDVFVPPYNRFDARQLGALAQRFAIVCGGPESIGQLGFQRPPQWRGETVYLPSYRPVYGPAAQVLAGAQELIERAPGLWVPVVLHWGWEAQDGWRELERLAALMAPFAARWGDFRAAIERSRAPAPSPGQQAGRSAVPPTAPAVDG
jgi:hypothetical protein